MGAGQSVPSQISKEKLYELTQSSRNVMNKILEYMMKEMSIRDFYLLSNPDECKKYVMFMANNLYKHFYELGISPSMDKKGIMVFRPVKEIVELPESDKTERQSLCVILSYFYTRIFQIFGALALTLIDDATVMTERGLLLDSSTSRDRGLLAPGVRPYITTGGAVITDNLGDFNFMKAYLEDEKATSNGYETFYDLIYFKIGTPTPTSGAVLRTRKKVGVFSIGYDGAPSYSYINIDIIDTTVNEIKVKFSQLKYRKKGDTTTTNIDLPADILDNKTISININPITGGRKRYSDITITTNRETDVLIRDFFDNLFEKIIRLLKALHKGDVSYLSKYSLDKSYISDKGVLEELKLTQLVHNLTIKKPLGHCIARALQLLRSVPIKGMDSESNICKAKFLETKAGLSRSGIPEPGVSLDTSPGMLALSKLFYDGIQYGVPRVYMDTKTLPKYIDFMKNMAVIFGDYIHAGAPRPDSDFETQGLSGIKNKRDQDICRGKVGSIRLNYDQAQNVYGFVNELYKRQLKHNANAGSIFNMLFKIEQDKSSIYGPARISFSDNILKKGIPEINRISALTRDVLIDYYKGCELTYLQGVKYIVGATATPPPPPGGVAAP
jgi:hypothetical protein